MGGKQQQLDEAHTSLRVALDACFDAALVVTNDAESEPGEVVFRNEASLRLAGVLDESLWKSEVDASRDRWIRLEQSGAKKSFTIRSAPITWKGRPARLVLAREETAERSFADDTDGVRREARQHAHRMNAMGQLTASVVHDFNNLLTAVNGYAELAMRKLEGHRALHDVEQIHRAAEYASSFSKRLLAFSRRRNPECHLVDLNEAIVDLTPILKRLLGESIELELSLDDNSRTVRIGVGQFEQVLVNLAINARDAMPEGGRFRIETLPVKLNKTSGVEARGAVKQTAVSGPETQAEVGAVGARDFVRLRVSDTGAGMDEVTVSRAFEPFFSSRESDEGTGLGLSTVKEIVHEVGGHIDLDSEHGTGTRFDIFLPTEDAELDGGSSTTRSGRKTSRASAGTVLVVEDEEAVLNVASAILDQRGYRVLTARDGAEALSVASAHEGEIDVLVTDVVMPRLGGVEAAKRLCETRPDCRVLFLSGYASSQSTGEENEPFVSDFLSKPFRSDDLPRKIQSLLRRPARGALGNSSVGRAKGRRRKRRGAESSPST
jgi:signal transduction histidine kinase/CheY-like chemotaxis protein